MSLACQMTKSGFGSPGGARLYIASGERESGKLAAVDTATGDIHHIAFPDRVLYKPWYQGLPPFSGMAISPDGRALWIPGHHILSPDRIESGSRSLIPKANGSWKQQSIRVTVITVNS